MYSIRKVIINCHLTWLVIWGHSQRMLLSNIHWKVLYPTEQEEAWNFKTSFKQGQWHLLFWINRGMIEKARQDLETNIRSSVKWEYTIEAVYHTWYTTGRADVIRLRNSTEDKRAFWRMLTSADRVVLVLKTKMADISLVSRVRTRLNNSWKHGKNSKKTTRRATSAIWRIFAELNNPKCALWVYRRWT